MAFTLRRMKCDVSFSARPRATLGNTKHPLFTEFVAMPLGQGYTVEGQITGKEVRILILYCFFTVFA